MTKILLVEDDPILCDEIKESISYEFKTIDIDLSKTYLSASKKIKDNFYDLFILDIMIPLSEGERKLIPNVDDLDVGFQLTKEINEKYLQGKRPKIVYFSAKNHIPEEELKKVDDFIEKPMLPDDYLEILSHFI